MKFHKLFSNSFIGLDVQATCMRLLQVNNTHRGRVIERLVEKKLPLGVVADGKIKQWDVLSGLLIEWVDELQITGMNVALQVPAHLVHMQRLQLPKGLAVTDIFTEITAKVQRDLPGMTDALSIDFSEIPSMSPVDSDDMDVIFTVGRREYLLHYKECVEAAGLRVKIIDVDAYVLLRAAYLDASFPQHDTTFLLHVTQEIAAFSVFHGHELIFYQTWSVLSKEDFLLRLHENMELCMALTPGLLAVKLGVSADSSIIEWLSQDAVWQERITVIDPFAQLFNAKTFNRSLATNNFLLALGLALREVPVW